MSLSGSLPEEILYLFHLHTYLPFDEFQSNIQPLLARFWSPPAHEGDLPLRQLHHVHQPVTIFVCQLFGAGMIVYSGFVVASSLKTARETQLETLSRED